MAAEGVSTRPIRKVGVLGSGVMGSGIAAHVANAGVPVVLLDVVPAGAPAAPSGERSALAAGAIERLKKTKPAPLMAERNARLITPGNLEDDLPLLTDCDWIVEAVVERLEVKQQVYRALDAVRGPGSIVSSNTSTLPLAALVEGLPESFARDFLITHFFNPPRYMRLLELVVGPRTRPEAAAAVRAFCDLALGKSVVACHDTPGFIANRIGTFWIEVAVRAAIELGLTVEEADAVAGKYLGFPKTGIFGLADLVGIDLMPHIAASLLSTLPEGDAYRAVHREEPLITRMIESGLTGRKGLGGAALTHHQVAECFSGDVIFSLISEKRRLQDAARDLGDAAIARPGLVAGPQADPFGPQGDHRLTANGQRLGVGRARRAQSLVLGRADRHPLAAFDHLARQEVGLADETGHVPINRLVVEFGG